MQTHGNPARRHKLLIEEIQVFLLELPEQLHPVASGGQEEGARAAIVHLDDDQVRIEQGQLGTQQMCDLRQIVGGRPEVPDFEPLGS
jgi:hypothetical protein